jgi:hypothetical protein
MLPRPIRKIWQVSVANVASRLLTRAKTVWSTGVARTTSVDDRVRTIVPLYSPLVGVAGRLVLVSIQDPERTYRHAGPQIQRSLV